MVSGVTGIVEKPIEGAKSGGAMGTKNKLCIALLLLLFYHSKF